MINILVKLKKNLEKNWSYVHKILFTFTFYLTFKIFVKVIDINEMLPYSIIFILLGFLVYTIDKLIDPFIDILLFFSNRRSELDANRKRQVLVVLFFILLTIGSTITYFSTKYYPLVSISLFSAIMAVISTGLFQKYTLYSIGKVVKFAVFAMFLLGMGGVFQCFYRNAVLTITLFIFIVLFFILDYRLDYWKKNYT